MVDTVNYVYKKEIDWSVLMEGKTYDVKIINVNNPVEKRKKDVYQIRYKKNGDFTERTIVVMHDAEKLIELCDQTGDLDDTSEYQFLIRLLKERTIIDGDGTRRLRKKEEVENPSEVLLNPSYACTGV